MNSQLPNTDPDLKLAQEFEEHRENNMPVNDIDDKLIDQLLQYKAEKKRTSGDFDESRQSAWNSIESATRQDTEARITPLFGSASFKWAAAALVLIAALLGFFYLQSIQKPGLLAQSFAKIKTVTLDDGSTIKLRPHSKLFSLDDEASTKSYKLEGEGYFDVTHNPNRTFSVSTQNGTLSVLGTKFTVSSWGNEMQVYLQKGSVKVKAQKQDSAVIMKPGQSATISDKNMVPVLNNASSKEFLDWLNQEITFKEKAAYKVTEEIEQQFDVTIKLPAVVRKNKISGTLTLDNLQRSLNYLELVLNGSFKKTNTKTYTFKLN